MLHTAELIAKKRDGTPLSRSEIQALVAGFADHSVTDSQVAAFAMAVWFRGMDVAEQSALTLAMRDSGTTLEWPDLNGPVLDKHSTGGVGDLVSLVLAPMVAASGGYVPMISGRGLGHTGGTLDKLESIPGFNTSLDNAQLQKRVREIGLAIVGQTDQLAPADRRLYAIRDVTATVASVPLIVSSILSKKLAEGLDGLVMDIKVGSGAFMQEMNSAQLLAYDICRVAVESGVSCNAVITDMDQPLSWSAGNGLELSEAISFLTGGQRHERLYQVVMELAAEMLILGKLQSDLASATAKLSEVLESGQAAECFARMVAAQGGPTGMLERPEQYLAAAGVIRELTAVRSGYVVAVDMRAIGMSVILLGGGRVRAEDPIDHSVGIAALCQPGLRLEPGTPLAIIHARNEADWERAAAAVAAAVSIADVMPGGAQSVVIWERIEGDRRA